MKDEEKYEAMEPSKKRYIVNYQQNKNARNTAINLNYKRKEQNKTEQWIQQRIQTYNLSKQAEEYKTMDPVKTEELLQKRKEKYCRNKSKNALKQLKRK